MPTGTVKTNPTMKTTMIHGEDGRWYALPEGANFALNALVVFAELVKPGAPPGFYFAKDVRAFNCADARGHMLAHVNDLAAVPQHGQVRRQTLAEKRLGGYWVLFRWGLPGFELHVHYEANGKVKTSDVKVVKHPTAAGEAYLSTADYAQVSRKVKGL